MKIECLTSFLHGTDRFELGDSRTVSAEDGAYFIANGWAKELGTDAVPMAQGDTTLDIQNSSLSAGVTNG